MSSAVSQAERDLKRRVRVTRKVLARSLCSALTVITGFIIGMALVDIINPHTIAFILSGTSDYDVKDNAIVKIFLTYRNLELLLMILYAVFTIYIGYNIRKSLLSMFVKALSAAVQFKLLALILKIATS